MNRIETRYGAILAPGTGDDMIGRFLLRYGEWAFDEARFIARNVPDDARILDIGAFLGTFGLGVMLERRLRQICFVEANPAITPLLQANVEANCRVPATVIEAIVTSAAAVPAAGHYTPGNVSSLSFVPSADPELGSELRISANIISLEQLIAEHGEFDLIKIDAEGMELDILQSDPSLPNRLDTALWLECNENSRSLTLVRALLGQGYCVFYFAFPSFSPDNFLHSSDPIFPFAFEAGLLCTRDRSPVLDAQLRANGCMLVHIETEEDLRRALWRTPRWAPREWVDRPVEQIVAMATRAIRGETYHSFLTADADGVGEELPDSELHLIRINRLEAALAEARRALQAERDATAAAEAKMRESQQLAAMRAEEIGGRLGQVTQELRASTQLGAALERTAALAAGRQVMLDETRASLAEAERSLAAARAETADLAARLERTQADAAQARGETADLATRLERAQTDAAQARGETADLATRLERAQTDAAQARATQEETERVLAQVTRDPVWRAVRPVRSLLSSSFRVAERHK